MEGPCAESSLWGEEEHKTLLYRLHVHCKQRKFLTVEYFIALHIQFTTCLPGQMSNSSLFFKNLKILQDFKNFL